MEEEHWQVRLLNLETGGHLMVTVVAEFEFEEKRYYAVIPDDDFVEVIRFEEDGESFEGLDDVGFAKVADVINAHLANSNVQIEAKEGELVLVGEANTELYENGEIFEVVDEEDEDHELLEIARVEHEGNIYVVVVDTTIDFFPAKPHGEDAVPLTAEEIEAMPGVFDEVAMALEEAMNGGEMTAGELN